MRRGVFFTMSAIPTDEQQQRARWDLLLLDLEQKIDTMVNRRVAAVVIALGVLFGALHYWPPK